MKESNMLSQSRIWMLDRRPGEMVGEFVVNSLSGHLHSDLF